MLTLTLKLVLPLTIFSFAIFTKWWYVQVVDWTDNMMYGFPLIYSAPGFHTSVSQNFFILEFLFDFLIYFAFWFCIVFLINRFVFAVKLNKVISIIVLSLTGLLICLEFFIVSLPDNVFNMKRRYDIEIMETGYRFIWEHQNRADYYDYCHPEENNR